MVISYVFCADFVIRYLSSCMQVYYWRCTPQWFTSC